MGNIDFVVLWVDEGDPVWQNEKDKYASVNDGDDGGIKRYRDWGLMKYWFRAVDKYAPWVHQIYFVTSGHTPEWLDVSHPKLKVVFHKEFIPDEFLPTFNSNVIELFIHLLPELSDQFVLFNDDMFLSSYVKPEDFFKKEYPRDAALFEVITIKDSSEVLPLALMNNLAVINQHFSKKEVIRKNWKKIFCLKYGKGLIRNVLLTPFVYFTGFRAEHLPSSYLKKTFYEVWQKEEKLLLQVGQNKFRSPQDLTHWLMKSWQICKGEFIPRRIRWGKLFELGRDDTNIICKAIETNKYKTVCLNDSLDHLDYETIKISLTKSFNSILGEPSEFERR